MIKLYSTGCPKCRIIKMQFDNKNIPYEIINDNNEIENKMNELNIRGIPFGVKDDKVYIFNDLIKYIAENQ